jgi:hypothetical protein
MQKQLSGLITLAHRLITLSRKYDEEHFALMNEDDRLVAEEALRLIFLEFTDVRISPTYYGCSNYGFLIVDIDGKGQCNNAGLFIHRILLDARERDPLSAEKHKKRDTLRFAKEEQLAEFIAEELLRFIPLSLIALDAEGDELIAIEEDGFGSHTEDASALNRKHCGNHRFCGGHLSIHRATKVTDVLCCDECGLRVHISRQLNTLGDLRTDKNKYINASNIS